jgi:hypothetical protein
MRFVGTEHPFTLSHAENFIMDSLQFSITSIFDRWRAQWRSVRIARTIYPALWESVRRKIPNTNETDLAEYAKVRAAQLAQQQVDVIMQANLALSGAFATRLLIKSTDRAVNLVLEAVTNARRAAA